MACEIDVCDECSRNCLLMHYGKHDVSQTISSFFKIMFGKKFSEVLIVPPSFSGIVASLKGKKTYLEDSNGKKWNVILSDVDGSLAIQKGWHQFSLDHEIKMGDLLIFHYIKGSHFSVQIYGTSGCVKTFPGEKSYQNKRPKTTKPSTTRISPSDMFYEQQEPPQENGSFGAYAVPQSNTETNLRMDDENESPVTRRNFLSKENGTVESPKLVPVADDLVEPYMSADRETSVAQEDDRAHLLNLSAFELADQTPSVSSNSRFKMGNKEVEAKEDYREHLLNLADVELPVKEKEPSFSEESDRDQLFNLSTSGTTDKEIENPYGKLKLEGSTCSQASWDLHKTQKGVVSIDSKKQILIQENIVIPSNKTEANLSKSEPSRPPISSPKPQTRDISIDTKKQILIQENIGMPLNKFEANLRKSEHSRPPIRSPSLGKPSTPIMPMKTSRKSDTLEPSASSGYCQPQPSRPSGKIMRGVKQEPGEIGQDFFVGNFSSNDDGKIKYGIGGADVNPMGDDGKIGITVKPEPVDFCDAAPAPFIRITCVVPADNESFLELPEPLPFKGRQSMRLKPKLVFLRDSAGRDWPVVYHARYSLKVLASGWSAFKKANNIRPGDECAFVVENIDKGIFQVQVLNN